MPHGKPDDAHSATPDRAKEMRLSRRSLLLGLGAGAIAALPLLSSSTQAAVSMLKAGIDPKLVEPEIIPAGKKGGKGGGRGKGRGRGKGHGHGKGHGRGRKGHGHGRGKGRGHHYYGRYRGRRHYGGRRYYGGYWGGCYDPWYRRRYWWRCTWW